MAWHCWTWHDMTWHVMTGHDMAWHYIKYHDVGILGIQYSVFESSHGMGFLNRKKSYMTWHDMTWHVMTWYDMLWWTMTWHDMLWHDMTCYDGPWHDMTWNGNVRDSVFESSHSITRCYMAWHGMAWDMTWHDMTWHDMWHLISWHDMKLCEVMLWYKLGLLSVSNQDISFTFSSRSLKVIWKVPLY